ncbi:MAG: glutamate-5-semialdehyde dehydrogenase [Gaiellaceae bacterium]|nr:glutamate-5-semialdehyde dehydrogenase [Gaiellaceae bacterium]
MTADGTRNEPALRFVEREAHAARAAVSGLDSTRIDGALRRAAGLLRERRSVVLAANEGDVDDASSRLDRGALDRLRLDDARIEAAADGIEATAALPPLEREIRAWRLPNGLEVSERRVTIGVVGANFEARPNVAADIAAQVLKSGNAVVLRTGGAALATVTALVDEVLRPALEESGLPGGVVGLVRTPERAGAEALVSLPDLVPLVILRGSGPSTAALARRAALNGVRTLAHAEGGGVLYVHSGASPQRLGAVARASLDRLGVCNRLNLALVDRGALALLPTLLDVFVEHGLEVRGTEAAADVDGVLPLDERLGHEWAADPDRVATVTLHIVDGVGEAVRIANDETSGLAATIVTEDEEAARRFLDGYRGTAALWNATTRFTDGFALLGVPETGVNVDRSPGPRGPVTYGDLCLRQYRIVGDGSQHR